MPAPTLLKYFYSFSSATESFISEDDFIITDSVLDPDLTSPHDPRYEDEIKNQGYFLVRKLGYKNTKHLKAHIYAWGDMLTATEYHYLTVFRNKDNILLMVCPCEQVIDMFALARYTGHLFLLNNK